MAKAPEATAGLCLNYCVVTLAKYTLHDHRFAGGHGIQAVTYRSTYDNDNKGKHFVRCPLGKGAANDCGYWYWLHQIPQARG